MKNSYYLLNRVFLFALFALLLNDGFLKSAYPSFLTGKLSDLAGLIVFVLFFTFLLGNQFKVIVFIGTSLLFCWWKSVLSSGFIVNWNEFFSFYPIQRVVDYSDLICLLVLVPVYFYKPARIQLQFHPSFAVTPLLMLSVFAITATSKARNIEAYNSSSYTYLIDKSFKLEMTHADFLKDLSFSNISFEKDPNGKPPEKATDPHSYILKNFTIHDGLVVHEMYISVREKKKHLVINLFKVIIQYPAEGSSKEIKKRITNETQEYFSDNL